MKKQQNGFTLIELIMVITVLGILAAFALPRFANLGGDARAATIEGVAASMRSASAIVHSAWLAGGSTGTTVDIEGASITVDAQGYPTAATIADAIQLDGDLDSTTTPGTISATGASGACEAVYTPSSAAAGVVTPPVVDTDVSGC